MLGHVTTTRLNGNHVTGYADTTVIGNYRYSWYVYVQSWMYLDTFPNEIGSYGTSARQALGAPTNPQNYDATLSYWGTGTYKVRGYHTAYTPFCNIYEPPYANGWSGWSTSNLTTVVRPTITRGVIPYFLGTGVTQSNDYSSQTALTIVNRNGAPETPTWSFVTGSTFGTLSCSNCVSATFMATMPGRFCTGYDVVLKASFNGFDSDWLWIDIQTPNLLEFVRVDEGTPAGGGWESHVDYRVRDGCNISMTNVTANEVFTTWQNFNGSNWDAPLKAAGWGGTSWDPLTGSWILYDILYEVPVPGKAPVPSNNGTNGYSEASSALMTQHTQVWRVGSGYNGSPTGIPPNPTGPRQGDTSAAKGVLVQTNAHYHYKDHGNHGRRFYLYGVMNMTKLQTKYVPILSALLTLAAGFPCDASSSVLQTLVESASTIVVCRIDSSRFDGTAHRVQIRVVYSIKGKLAAGDMIAAVWIPSGGSGQGTQVPNTPTGNVLVFMNQDNQGEWQLLSLGYPALGLAAAAIGIADEAVEKPPSLRTRAPLDSVIQLMAKSVEVDPSQAANFVRLVGLEDAAAVLDAWVVSPSPVLRMYGLAMRISAKQDADAVLAATRLQLPPKEAAILWSSILGYRNPDPKGVAAIGRVAIDARSDASIVFHCAESLSAIHTAATLPYLYELMGNADSKVRELGVAGFSAFVAKMRIAQAGADSSEALDEVSNPGRRRHLPSRDAPFETETTRQHYRFGPFRSSDEDASFVSFWRGWYEQNRALLAPE